ncbi:MAG: hypothetical protein WBB45_18985 [Cyclobacteriaceae bacterium]
MYIKRILVISAILVQALTTYAQTEAPTAIKALRPIMKEADQLPKPLSKDQKREIADKLEAFDKQYATDEAAADARTQMALQMAKVVRLDTAIVPDKVVKATEKALIKMIENDELNYSAMLGVQVLGTVASQQPPVHPSRVRVLEMLVKDHLEGLEITSAQELDGSGIPLLVMVYSANKNYDKALEYNTLMIRHLDEMDAQGGYDDPYRQRVYLQIESGQFQEALKTIETYKSGHMNDEMGGGSLDDQIKLNIYEAHAHSGLGQYDEANRILQQQQATYEQRKEEIFGSGTKDWLEFSLMYADAEINHQAGRSDKAEKLNDLLEFVKGKADTIQYRSMYAQTEQLLAKLGESIKIKELPALPER